MREAAPFVRDNAPVFKWEAAGCEPGAVPAYARMHSDVATRFALFARAAASGEAVKR
jgi:hypothetical protein